MFSFIELFVDEVAEFKDKVIISIIYNCTEPLEKDRLKRMKSNSNYKAHEDILQYPVFILRKCQNSENPCRIFIDHIGRVYTSWDEYLSKNKLSKCIMVVPKDGR